MTITLVVAYSCGATVFANDLYQPYVRTVEWLVDNSDTILVYQRSVDGQTQTPVRSFKGDASAVSFPLKSMKRDGRDYLQKRAKSSIRLAFIKAPNQLIFETDLARESVMSHPGLFRVLYGVSQYGELIVTQQSLFAAIRNRVENGPGTILARNPRRPHTGSSGTEAPRDFPFESSDFTYVLLVPFTKERRDYHLKRLKTGSASERVDAIRNLADFGDAESWRAIRNAAKATGIQNDVRYLPSGQIKITLKDVRAAVEEAERWAVPGL